ncbi:hypothetical protein CYMTET_35908, partial [Cymbomonas tetramitiformis]
RCSWKPRVFTLSLLHLYQVPSNNPSGAQTRPTKWNLHECPDECHHLGHCESGRCFCNENNGWRGESCSEEYTPFCLNQCSGRGDCVEGFCHCRDGFYGMDCSLVDEEKAPQCSRPESPVERPFPLIYVYDLPPYLLTWKLSACRETFTCPAIGRPVPVDPVESPSTCPAIGRPALVDPVESPSTCPAIGRPALPTSRARTPTGMTPQG